MLTHRLATLDDLPQLQQLMARAIARLQQGFLSDAEIMASHQVMGLDEQLIIDGSYFVVEKAHQIVGCGGWSWRATLYGGSKSIVAREPEPLNPATDAARIRAMYTDPDHARQGIGRLILSLCEQAAYKAGFQRVEMMATLSGEALYAPCGYHVIEEILSDPIDGVRVPLKRMGKLLWH